MPAGSQIPKGARVLPTPDWFINDLSSAGALVNPASVNFSQISLFNDATDGRYLYVYGLCVASPNGKLNVYQNMPVNGAKVGQGFSAISGTGANPGSLYVYNNAAPPPEYSTFLTFNSLDLQAENLVTPLAFFPGFPLAVLGPGWALVVNETTAAANLVSATFWWVALKP
jgi:hypothetical protein